MIALRVTYLASLLVGIGYLIAGWEQSLGSLEMPGDGVFPLLVGSVFTLLSLIAVLHKPRPEEGLDHDARVFPRGEDLQRLVWIILCLVLFAALFRFLGFHVCTLALMIVTMRILGPWGWLKIIVVSLIVVSLSYFLFQYLLEVPLPQGSLWA